MTQSPIPSEEEKKIREAGTYFGISQPDTRLLSCITITLEQAVEYAQKKYQEGELNGVKWSVAVIDDIHMKNSHAHAEDEPDKVFKGVKNQLRDRFKFVSGVDPAPTYPVNVTLQSQLERNSNMSIQDEGKLVDPSFREKLAEEVFMIYGGAWGNALGTADRLLKLIQYREQQATEKWKSFCGCPMCEHHSSAYALHSTNKPCNCIYNDGACEEHGKEK